MGKLNLLLFHRGRHRHKLAFSSGRHSFSRSLSLDPGETAGSLLAKVSDLIGIKPDFLVLWKGGPLLDEVFLCL
mgnify:CR=1 FL=1